MGSTRMRVLVVSGYYKPAYVYGGPVKSVSELCEGMARLGADVTVFTTDANGRGKRLSLVDGRKQVVEGVEVRYYAVDWALASLMPFYSAELAGACRDELSTYDVVYLPSTWTHAMWAAARIAIRKRVPYVVSPRGSFMEWSLEQKALKKKIYLSLFERRFVEAAAAIHATTELEARQQTSLGFSTPVSIIPNGIDTRRFSATPGAGRLRRKLGLNSDALISLFVGRLHPEKRVEVG